MASRTIKAKLKKGGPVKLKEGGAAKVAPTKLAEGGKVQEYNAQGSKEMAESKETGGGFKGGGTIKGGHGKARMDKRARGGGVSGHSAYSSGRSLSGPVKDMAGKGHMGEMPREVD